jgi:hypothetical protein
MHDAPAVLTAERLYQVGAIVVELHNRLRRRLQPEQGFTPLSAV